MEDVRGIWKLLKSDDVVAAKPVARLSYYCAHCHTSGRLLLIATHVSAALLRATGMMPLHDASFHPPGVSLYIEVSSRMEEMVAVERSKDSSVTSNNTQDDEDNRNDPVASVRPSHRHARSSFR